MPTEREKYLKLVHRRPLLPIRSDKDLANAIRVIDSLIDRPSLSRGEQDYLDVLSDLVEAYETEHDPMPQVPDDRMLRHLLEAKGVSQAEVARATGIATPTISAVLNRERRLTRKQIGLLSAYFHVEPGVFMFGEVRSTRSSRRSDSTPRRRALQA